MPLPTLVILTLCFLACAALSLIRSVHMFQLSSYQDPSYRTWLASHKKEHWNAKRLVPAAVMLLGSISLTSLPWLFAAGTGLFLLLNRPPKAKKPLVCTARVKRLLACAGVCMLLWAALSSYISACLILRGILTGSVFLARMGLIYPVLALVLAILFQHRLVMVYNDLMSPVEKAISQKYINQARDILRSMPDLRIIGITGSYGKTSTKYFLEQLLSTRYSVYMTPGNYNTTLGVVRAVREGLRPYHQIFLCEMGARHVGDIAEICDLVHPGMGIVTSVGPQHLETFGSLANVLSTKLELAQAVRDRGPVFLNYDSKPLFNYVPHQQVISYGENGQHYRITDLSVNEEGSRFTVTDPQGAHQTFTTRLLGRANVQNLCGAIAVSAELGIPMEQLVPAVRRLESVPHRLQLIRQTDLSIIDDAYNSNPEGAKNALDTLALCHGTRIVITPGLVELGSMEQDYNRTLGAQAAASCDWLITVGESDRVTAIQEGARAAGLHRDRILSAPTVQEAMAQARALPGEGKLVLLLNDLTDNY